MITTYALSLPTVDCTEQQRIAVIDIVSDWLVEHYPLDARGPGTTVRTREASDDPVFRLTITESAPGSSHVETLTISVVLIADVLTFDIRISSTPTAFRVIPFTSPLLPVRVAHLVKKVLDVVPSEDANRYITDAPSVVTTEMGGQEIAAFVLAPSRRLPVIVEVLDYERRTPLLIAMGAGPLVGLVHVVQITTAEALHGFLSLTGYTLVGPGCIVVNWAETRNRRLFIVVKFPPHQRIANALASSS